MSLRSFLNTPEIRKTFSKTIKKPRLKIESDILAPALTKNYSIVGIAFDYLFRMFLKKLNSNALERDWIPEKLLSSPTSPILENPELDLDAGKVVNYKDTKASKKLKQILLRLKKGYSKYLKTGKINEKLIRSTLILSKFDQIYRSGRYFEIKNNIDKNDIKDLNKLLSIAKNNQNKFISQNISVLNPTFGRASEMIGGADADILIDDIIIDVKTTQKGEFSREIFNQLLGYYFLSLIGGIDGVEETHEISRIGVYYSRFGELVTLKVSDFLDEKTKNDFLEWFKSRIENFNIE